MKKYRIFIIASIILIISAIYFVSISYQGTSSYLKRNHANLSILDDEDFSGLDILSKDLKDVKIVFAGEHHNVAENQSIDLKLLKYLQREIGVNYYLAEIGYADSYFLNKYLESGDEAILENYFNIYKNRRFYTEERYNFFVNLYKFNQTLPKSEQIKIIGVDIESGATDEYILDVWEDKDKMTKGVEYLLSELKDFNYNAEESYKNVLKILDELIKDINDNKEDYENILKEDFAEFELVIDNLYKFSNARLGTYHTYDIERDGGIYENFKKIDSNLENPVYFGQWGSDHIYQDTIYSNLHITDINFFASLLNKDLKYKDKILSINIGYYFDKPSLNHSKSYINEELFDDYLESESKATIFRLNNIGSPFKKQTLNPFDTNEVDYKGKPVTDYYQYLILLREGNKSKQVYKFEN